ncbi:MAG: peptidylprolyl isomerase [Candidatus Porifericomitaceae bacterium WSBS_2022_MAG_OTU9]
MICNRDKNSKFVIVAGMYLLLAGMAALPWQPARAEGVVLDQIIAIVNNDVILNSEFNQRKALLVSQIRNEGGVPPSDLLLQKQVLDAMITSKLQLQLAAVSEIDVQDGAVDAMISDIATRNNVTLAAFRNVLERDGFSFPLFREEIREEMIVRTLRQRQVERQISVSDNEVEFYLNTLERQGATGKEYRLSHILLSSDDSEDSGVASPELMARAAVVKETLDEGEAFATVAVAFSDAGNAADGGDLGWRRFNQVPTAFVNILPEMKPGQIVGPISSASGLYFLTLVESRSVDRVLVQEARVRHIFIRTTENRDLELALERANIARQRVLRQGDDFAVVAADMSDDIGNAVDGGVLGWVRAGERGPDFDQVLQDAEINELSEPVRSRGGWHIIQVLERRQYDDTEFSIKEKARESIYRRKLDSAYRGWLDDMRNEAYIEVRLGDQGSQG